MKYYIGKNNSHIGPFTESEIVDKVSSGEFSPNDLCIPHGGSQWSRLSQVFPHITPTANITPPKAAISKPPVKKRRWGLILGILGAVIVGILLIASVLGFIVYRNLFPADSLQDLPDQVKDFKLEKRYPGHGDVWGTKTWYGGMYSVPPSKDYLIYLMDIHKDQATAKENMESDLLKDCKDNDKPLRFSFEKGGVEVAEGATCYAGFYVHKDNRVVTLGKVGTTITIDNMTEFMENLPFIAGSKMVAKK